MSGPGARSRTQPLRGTESRAPRTWRRLVALIRRRYRRHWLRCGAGWKVKSINKNKYLYESIIIDNRAGAGSSIGMELGARAAPDGYTVLIATANIKAN